MKTVVCIAVAIAVAVAVADEEESKWTMSMRYQRTLFAVIRMN